MLTRDDPLGEVTIPLASLKERNRRPSLEEQQIMQAEAEAKAAAAAAEAAAAAGDEWDERAAVVAVPEGGKHGHWYELEDFDRMVPGSATGRIQVSFGFLFGGNGLL